MAQFYNRLDIILVATLTSATQVAEYAPASRLQDALYLLPGALAVVGLTVFARAWSQGIGRGASSSTRWPTPGNRHGSCDSDRCLVVVFAPFLVRVALGAGSILIFVVAVRILAWSVVASAFIAPLLAALVAVGRAVDATKVDAATFASALVLHVSLDWWAGSTGAAVASLCRDFVGALVAYLLARRAGILPHASTSGPNLGPVHRSVRRLDILEADLMPDVPARFGS